MCVCPLCAATCSCAEHGTVLANAWPGIRACTCVRVHDRMCVCVCVRAHAKHVRICVPGARAAWKRVGVRACDHVCVCVCVCMRAQGVHMCACVCVCMRMQQSVCVCLSFCASMNLLSERMKYSNLQHANTCDMLKSRSRIRNSMDRVRTVAKT